MLKKYASTIIFAVGTIGLLIMNNKTLVGWFILVTTISFFRDKNKDRTDMFVKECQDDKKFEELQNK